MVGNCFLPFLLIRAVQPMRIVQYRTLAHTVLSPMTRIAFALPGWFFVFTALSILACVGLFHQKVSVERLAHLLLIVSFLECIALFCFALGICSAFYGTRWR